MHSLVLTCPPVGHRLFEKSLTEITLGDVEKPGQISKFIRARSCTQDGLGAVYQEGELQRLDMKTAMGLFAYPQFLATAFSRFSDRFNSSECRVYQFETVTTSGGPFVFGMFITDDQHNLIDYCVESNQHAKRKPILLKLIRAICTPRSVAIKLSH
ncbi:hypothetical protein [Pseudoduganella sp. R-34]|uniref:hypothetical protein n=1 Tax=Pseudoduganella sp. R-34 TaxID=3404062 RepID=UPI003CEEDAE8